MIDVILKIHSNVTVSWYCQLNGKEYGNAYRLRDEESIAEGLDRIKEDALALIPNEEIRFISPMDQRRKKEWLQ